MSDEPSKSKAAFRIAALVLFVLLVVLFIEIAMWGRVASSPEVDIDVEHQKVMVPARGPAVQGCPGDRIGR
jgi:hypothetical protein